MKMAKKNNTLQEVADFLQAQQEVTLLAHVRPDGDTLGSAIGLKRCLEALGKRVQVLCADPVSPRYRDLSDGQERLEGTPRGAVVCIDMASPELAGDYQKLAEEADLVIDHHPTNPFYGKCNYVDAAAGATGEILVDLAQLLGVLPQKAAEALYTAIATDTGCFKYGNTTEKTHLRAAALIQTGFDLTAVNRRLFQTKSRAELEITRLAMETLRFYGNNRIVTMRISRDMMQKSGAGADELETISSIPIQLEGAVVAATFKEGEPDQHRVSLRTNGTVDGGKICALFGGGGHKMAAGCSMNGTYEKAERQMIRALLEALGVAD